MAASRGNKLNLQDSLLDTPKVHGHLNQFETTLAPFRDYVSLLRDILQACHLHQEKVGEGTRALANLIGSIDSELGEKTGSSTFSQLSRYQAELSSCQEMYNSQLQNAVVNKMSALLEEDIDNMQSLKEAYDNSRSEHEHAMAKFSRASKRRDSDKSRFEANAELYVARKKFYQCTLDYCTQLNEFQMRKKFMLLEPVVTFMHAQMGYFKACHEIMSSSFQQLLTALNGDIQSCHRDYENEARELQQQKIELELQFPTLCVPDPDLSDPFTEFPTANTGLSSKYGYLYLRIQKSGLAAKWERTFFFTKNGYLYTQSLHKTAESLLHLKEAEAFCSDCDDRRYVIQITHPTLKKPVFLQAENDTQRTEWLSMIHNSSAQKHGATVGGQGSDVSRIRSRLYDSLEREKIRTWATKESQPETSSTPSSSSSSSTATSTLKATSTSLKTPIPPARRSKSPNSLRSNLKITLHSGSSSPRDSKSSQRNLGLLSRSGKKSTSVPTLPPGGSGGSSTLPPGGSLGLSTLPPGGSLGSSTLPPGGSVGSKLADVESWVHSTTAATTGMVPPPRPLHPPTSTAASESSIGEFHVKYLGQKEVQDPKNASVISETIRGVVAARAFKKVKPATSIELSIQLKKLMLTEIQSGKMVGGFLLKDIANCAAHHEDEQLFGIICRTDIPADPERVKYICHVMQADQSGSEVCGTISAAIQRLWKMMQNKGTGSRKSSTDKTQSSPTRLPPPVIPYSLATLLGSYNPVPAGPVHTHHRTHTSPGSPHQNTQVPAHYRNSRSDSNLPAMMMARPGSGSGPGEEVGMAGSGSMSSILIQPPSLPESSLTSAESLGLGRDRDSPLMFADIIEESEELPLISFDQRTLGGTATQVSSAHMDGYVSANPGGSDGIRGVGDSVSELSSLAVNAGHGSSGYVTNTLPSSVSPSPSPSPTQLTLPSQTTPRPSPSPPPPPPPTPPSRVLPLHLSTSSSQKNNSHPPTNKITTAKNGPGGTPTTSPEKMVKMRGSETGQKTLPTPAISAADSLAQALGFETIPPPSPPPPPAASETTDNITAPNGPPETTTTIPPSSTTTTTSATKDPLAEAFGFDTTPEDIENLIELMGPAGTERYGEGVANSGYMTSNPTETTSYSDWTNFDNSK